MSEATLGRLPYRDSILLHIKVGAVMNPGGSP
jgi:hypothetical protein